MKRIALFLAAAAATLASCVKENNLAPEQTSDNLVTIKALATKTTLDENIVIWEQDDEIAVVLEGVENAVNFEIDGEVNGASAKFVGTIAPETEYNSAYAVYPATAYTVEAGLAKITHSLPETQTGVITSGMILSSALLDAEELKAGNATANFHNALTLVKVIVPAGVQSVSLTSDNLSGSLVGSSTFNAPDEAGVLKKTGEISARRTVTLSTGSELTAGTYDLLVYPGTVTTLTLTMVGTDGAEYTSAVSGITFKAGEYRTIDLTKVFKMDVGTTKAVNPTGEKVTIPVAATEQYTYTVDIEDNPSWISVETSSYVQTKAFVGTNIVFNVEGNTTGTPREANVTITWNDGEDKSKSFVITQESAYLDFVYVDGNPANELIQWEESFGVYSSESDAQNGTNANNTYSKKVFNIELSDDPEKGTYMIKNMFYADSYFDANGQLATGGAKYYADYADGVLTVKKNDSGNSYFFSDNILLTYDSANKKFTAAPIPTTYSNVWIGGYTVTVKVDDPGAGGDEGSISGDWNQIVTFGSSSAVKTGASASVTVSVSGDQVTLENFVFSGCTATGTLSEKTITISAANADLPTTYGPVDNDIVITLSDDMKTMTASNITTGYGYGIVVDSWTAELP